MRVLIIKTSSLGDIIHTLPALTEAVSHIPNIQFDWVVEESFQQIPTFHPAVRKVFPIAIRRWRKAWGAAFKQGEIQAAWRAIRAERYDVIIDGQGLLKSALIAGCARGLRAGLSFRSAREPLASLLYQKRIAVSREEHAVTRLRLLFAQALQYPISQTTADYGLQANAFPKFHHPNPYYVLLHGTTWVTKHWPEEYWKRLAHQLAKMGFDSLLLWGNPVEHARALRIAEHLPSAHVLPRLDLAQIAGVLANAKGCVTVDTGLGHLAAALDVPSIALYGPSNPIRSGTLGKHQIHLLADFPCAPCGKRVCRYPENAALHPPCFAKLPPEQIWTQIAHQQKGL